MSIKMFGAWICTAMLLLNGEKADAQKDSSRSKWLPDHAKIQFAGGIGFFSAGVGYKTKKDKWHADLFYGYAPASVSGLNIHALTGKVTWFPVKNIDRKSWQLRPFTAGALVNYTFGEQYFGFSPDNYPYDYYGHPTAFHVAAFIGGQVNKKISDRKGIKRIGLYYELGSFDVEMISYVGNRKALSITDILNLGIGAMVAF